MGINRATVKAIVNNVAFDNGQSWKKAEEDTAALNPLAPDAINAEAAEALADRTGVLWCRRYFGIELSPWQAIAWEKMEDLFDSPDREFLCLNAAPGLGKSSILVAFAAKLVARERAIRILFISRAQSLAERNTMRLRRALERTSPAVGAPGCLSLDFGRFRPAGAGDVWRRNEFVVEQLDGTPIEEKEPTASAFGFDSEWLGNRLDVILGDDLDSTRSLRNFETVSNNRQIFDDELEPRLEGRGLFVIAQQRLGTSDFSAHALSKTVAADDDGVTEDLVVESQYHHLAFKAHYEELCGGNATHRYDAAPWPDGCLLDPRRLTWRDLRKAMNSQRRFAVVYQQGDSDESAALVPRIWIEGGQTSRGGEEFPGCWDKDRGAMEFPANLVAPNLSVVTVDPSPTRFWAIEHWLVNQPTGQRFLLDLIRQAMDAPSFLDWNLNAGVYTGVAEEWWQRSNDLGIPFTWLVVEANCAQRFMLQHDYFRRWASSRGVTVIPHQTHRNKAHPEFGIQAIAPHYRFGRVRLPGKQGNPGRLAAMKLVDEVTRWPEASTDDTILAHWFMEYNLEVMLPTVGPAVSLWRPTWLGKTG